MGMKRGRRGMEKELGVEKGPGRMETGLELERGPSGMGKGMRMERGPGGMGKRMRKGLENRERARRVCVSVRPWVCVSAALCLQPPGWPCVLECQCAFERLRVLYVHVSVSMEYVCVHGRVTLCRVRTGRFRGFAPSPTLRFRGAAGCGAPYNREGGPSRVPGFQGR